MQSGFLNIDFAELRQRINWLSFLRECLILLVLSAMLLLVLHTTRLNHTTLQEAIKAKVSCMQPVEHDELYGILSGMQMLILFISLNSAD